MGGVGGIYALKDQSDDQNWRDSLSCGEIDTTLTKGWNSNINIDYTKE